MKTFCRFCGEEVVDGREESGFTGEGPDWMTPRGDFGCAESPEASDGSCGSHAVTDAEVYRAQTSEEAFRVADAKERAYQAQRRIRDAAPEFTTYGPRAVEMLIVAARYIRELCGAVHETIRYDDADCDGECVADDCVVAAEMLALALAKARGEK